MNALITSSLSDQDARFLRYLEARGRSNAIAPEHLYRLLEETSDRLAAVVLKLGLLAEDDLVRAAAARQRADAACPRRLERSERSVSSRS
jgi:hypothetical protein